ncbi:MAG TPA: xanthine dehydrogenase family protein molybdopterin-binding subunit [bacterium]|nr:xanthine dehydrogenase family protein molybdopterin-binding subunit [bacterium]
MTSATPPSRREFLKTGARISGSLVVAFVLPGMNRVVAPLGPRGPQAGEPFIPNAFVRVGSDDSVTILLAHSEMGQGIWTSLPMLVAEELDADWLKIKVEHAKAAPEYAHTTVGLQMTGGSTTTLSEWDRYRQAGATARTLLVQAAAQRFGITPADCRTESGVVIAGKQRARYGELALAAAKLPPLKEVSVKEPKDWKLIGKPMKRLDTPEKITGRAQFGMDVRFPGLLTAVVAHPPVFGATVKSFGADAARAVPGVRSVVQIPTGVAVVADHFWAAKLGRDALKIDWDLGPNGSLDSTALREQFRELAGTAGVPAAAAGSVNDGLQNATRTIEAEYAFPYLAHAPMEPENCAVRIGPSKCEIWTGTQFQGRDQQIAAQISGLKPEQVDIHTTFLGGGFGRRANFQSDFVAEAVQVAKAANAPVKTVWTREDDIRGGQYRSAFLHRARIGLGSDGQPLAWHHAVVGQSILIGTPFEQVAVKDGIDPTSVEGLADSPYLKETPNHRVELHSPKTGIPVLWWRSVGNSHTAFVVETLIDELAQAAGKDPVEYRRGLLKNYPRHLGVLNLAVDSAGWDRRPPAGRARGVAVHAAFGSFAAQVAEVSVDNRRIRVHRVVCAIDCGTVINPETVAAQMESGIAFGLSAALHSALHFKDGQVQESNYHDYRVLRLNEMPVVDVHIVPSTEKPGGVGEVAVPHIAPAVANAVARLTGQRLRELPLRLNA